MSPSFGHSVCQWGKKQRTSHLEMLRHEMRTMIFYEAPHKLVATLHDLAAVFGDDRRIALVRELTKLHEEVFRTTIGGALARYDGTESTAPRGEFVLIVEGASEAPEAERVWTVADAAALAQQLRDEEGLSASEAAKRAAAQTGCRKNEIYTAMNAL